MEALNIKQSPAKTYSGVDVFKFFFAICIVALHTSAFDFLPETTYYFVVRLVFRCAVPYFFVASGFFLGKKLFSAQKEDYADIIRSYCTRLLRPLVFFEIISLVYNAIRYACLGVTLKNNLFLLAQSVVFYPFGALWYVQACIVGALLLYPFLKKDKLCLAIIIGVFLYGFALLANNYSFLLADTPFEQIVKTYLNYCVSARNGVFTGFISIALGVFCSKIYANLQSKAKLGIVFGLSCLCYITEVICIRLFNNAPLDDSSLYITHLILIPVLFLITLHIRFPVSQKLSVSLRNLSTGVYFLHRPILYLVGSFITIRWLSFLVVLCFAIALCLTVYKTKAKPFDTLLK